MIPARLFYFPMTKEAQAEETTSELSDLDVVTLGLVKRAAVGIYEDGANVFLLKQDKESPMADELDIEQVDETPAPEQAQDENLSKTDQNLLQKFLTFLKGEVEKANPVALQQAARILTAGGYRVTAAKLAELLGYGDEDDDVEMKKSDPTEGGNQPVSEETTVVNKAIEDRLAELEKAQTAQIEAVKKALEEEYKGQLEAFQKQADEARTEVTKANEARETREWIEKAGEMTFALGADQKELGKHLHTIAKTAPAESVDYIVAVLKAADHTLTEGNLFSEFGTAQVSEQATAMEKAEQIAKEKGIPLGEAMLELSLAEQAEITKGFKEAK